MRSGFVFNNPNQTIGLRLRRVGLAQASRSPRSGVLALSVHTFPLWGGMEPCEEVEVALPLSHPHRAHHEGGDVIAHALLLGPGCCCGALA